MAGWDDSTYSVSQVQLFLRFLPGGGWNIGSSPIINYDWQADQWTVPINKGASKTLTFGETPVKLNLELNYYVEKPDAFGPDWMVSFDIAPVVPNFIDQWVKGL